MATTRRGGGWRGGEGRGREEEKEEEEEEEEERGRGKRVGLAMVGNDTCLQA